MNMVFTIEQLGTKSLSLNNKSQDINVNNEGALLWPVIAMYDSFVPWLSPQSTEHSKDLRHQQQPRGNSWWFSRWLSKKKEQQWEDYPCAGANDDGTQDAPGFCESIDPLDENEYRRASLRFPPQAHSLASFHLSGIQTKRHVINFGRVAHHQNLKGTDKGDQESPTFISSCATLEVGTLIDFIQPTSDFSTSSNLQDTKLIQVMHTSDKDILAQEMARQLTSTNIGEDRRETWTLSRKHLLNPHLPWHPSHFRVAAIGNHCRCVSWGLESGSITVYKRMNDTWTTTAVITPSSQEYERIVLRPEFATNTSGSSVLQCPSLNLVSDIVPLIVPTYDGSSSNALIIFSRIGGCIEIHPLHTSIWRFISTEDVNATAKGHTFQQKRPSIMRLSSDSGVVIDTRKYHNDTICIDVQTRDLPFTSHQSVYGNYPPICFTIAASGTLTRYSATEQAFSQPVISLWSVEMIMSQQQNESINVSSIQYQILRVLSPSNQEPFLPPSLLRKCRVVADTFLLKRYLSHYAMTNGNNDRKQQCIEPIIEFTTPYIQLQLTASLNQWQDKSNGHYNIDQLLVSALDYYGSISLFYINGQSKSLDLFEVISTGSLPSHSTFSQFQWLSDLSSKKRSHTSKNIMYLAGVTQSGLLSISKLETDTLDSCYSSNRRLRFVFLEEKSSQPKNLCTFMIPPTELNGFCNQGFSFVRCRPSKDALVDIIQKQSLLCSIFRVQKLHPLTLAKQMEVANNHRGAIALLKSCLSSADCSSDLGTDLLNKALWEALTRAVSIESLNIDDVQKYLHSIQDDDYVVHASVLEYSNLSSPKTLRSILDEGLCRLMKLQKEIPIEKDGGWGDDERRREIIDLLEERIICLGTYEWFCRHLCVEFQSSVFFSQFIETNKLVIAKECALKGDIDALFVVFLRHGNETLPYRLQLLSLLPPTLCPASYSHLLPAKPSTCSSIEGASKQNSNFFLIEPNTVPVDLKHILLHFDCFFPKSNIHVSDIACMERSHRFTQVGDGEKNSEVLAAWYIAQVLKLEKIGGCLKHAIQLCQLGIERIPRQEGNAKKISDQLHLESLLASLMHFDFCYSYCTIPETMTFSGWCSLEVASAIPLILGEDSEPDLALSRWELCIAPMMKLCKNDNFRQEWGWKMSSDLADIQEEAEQAITTYLFHRCKYDFLRGLSLCLIFASHSKATLRRSSRIINSDKVLTRGVMDCLYNCQYFTSGNVKQVMNMFWDIYETLPARNKSEDPDSSLNILHSQIDLLERHLIATDISSNYFVPFPLHFLLSYDDDVGDLILKKMCISMRDRALQNTVSEERARDWKEISIRFAIDVNELQSRAFITLGASIIEENLLNLLLDDQKFLALKEVYLALINFQEFTGFPFKLENEVKHLINTGQIEAAEELAKTFSSLYPEINEGIDRMKSLREALLVIVEVLGCDSITYDSLERQSPYDILGLILNQNPLAIVSGNEWRDQEYSTERNHKLWNDFLAGSSFSGIMLPGHIVHRVAVLLGLSKELDEFCVNQLMIFFGIQAGLYGAAASLCINSLRYAHSFSIDSSSEVDLYTSALHNVALLVSANDYSDYYIRKELCVYSLTNIMSKEIGTASFETGLCLIKLIEQFSLLDANQPHFKSFEVSNEHRGSNLQQHTSTEFLVFKAVGIVAEGAKNVIGQKKMEKNKSHIFFREDLALNASCLLHPLFDEFILGQEDFKELFTHLRLALHSAFYGKTVGSETEQIVKSSLSVIGRRIFSLCIAEAARLRDRHEWQTMLYSSSIKINDLVQLAVSVLLESMSRSYSKQIVTELKGQLEEEVSIAMNHAANYNRNDTPDEEIVKRLRHYGYSFNGACRATLATRSSNFEAALSYAISHCQDKDFDFPLPTLHKPRVPIPTSFFVDQIVVRQVANSLQFLIYMDEQVRSSLGCSVFFSKLHSALSGNNFSSKTNTPIVTDSAPRLPSAGEREKDYMTKTAVHELVIEEHLKTASGSERSTKPSQTYQHSIRKEKQPIASVKPKLIARACVDTILSSDVKAKMLGEEEKRRFAQQGRRLLEASRKAKISSQSPNIKLTQKAQIQQSTNHQSSSQATLACGDEPTDFGKTQVNIVKPELSQGKQQEGWDFEDDW